jgi:hypothetical protein
MQSAVNDQAEQLAFQGLAVAAGVALGGLHADDDFAQQVLAVGRWGVQWETEDIGRIVVPQKLAVEGVDSGVIAQDEADLHGLFKPFAPQGHLNGVANFTSQFVLPSAGQGRQDGQRGGWSVRHGGLSPPSDTQCDGGTCS